MAERYSFDAEWFDVQAEITRKYLLMWYIEDSLIEVFDLRNKRMFLKKIKVPGISLDDIYVGGVVNVYGRQFSIKDYGDDFTKQALSTQKQKTLAIIKPHAIKNAGAILAELPKIGLKIGNMKMVKLERAHAEEFYAEHVGKGFFENLAGMMTSGPAIAIELIGNDAIAGWRKAIGPTKYDEAKEQAPDSIRGQFAEDNTRNAVHGSDSVASAQRETAFFFDRQWPSTAIGQETALVLIKPHAVIAGHIGAIIENLSNAGFVFSALEMFTLSFDEVEEFLEVYKGVVPEYATMVSEMSSGPCIAIEVAQFGVETSVAVTNLRMWAGPRDPSIAKQIRKESPRALYGEDKARNAVHVTDLPEDAPLEIEYFFKILQG